MDESDESEVASITEESEDELFDSQLSQRNYRFDLEEDYGDEEEEDDEGEEGQNSSDMYGNELVEDEIMENLEDIQLLGEGFEVGDEDEDLDYGDEEVDD